VAAFAAEPPRQVALPSPATHEAIYGSIKALRQPQTASAG
jgi:hypothetical protein